MWEIRKCFEIIDIGRTICRVPTVFFFIRGFGAQFAGSMNRSINRLFVTKLQLPQEENLSRESVYVL